MSISLYKCKSLFALVFVLLFILNVVFEVTYYGFDFLAVCGLMLLLINRSEWFVVEQFGFVHDAFFNWDNSGSFSVSMHCAIYEHWPIHKVSTTKWSKNNAQHFAVEFISLSLSIPIRLWSVMLVVHSFCFVLFTL